jgi:hypothetical protein
MSQGIDERLVSDTGLRMREEGTRSTVQFAHGFPFEVATSGR